MIFQVSKGLESELWKVRIVHVGKLSGRVCRIRALSCCRGPTLHHCIIHWGFLGEWCIVLVLLLGPWCIRSRCYDSNFMRFGNGRERENCDASCF